MIKHTPGPWKQGNYKFFAHAFANPEYPIHAPKRGCIGKAYRDVDAKMFALAPEFLQALRDAVAALGGIQSDNVPKTVRAAIAKAEGEQT